MLYITGDTHRNFKRIFNFCQRNEIKKEDNVILIIVGDAGINYCLDQTDKDIKANLSKLPITLFCLHGNHEERPYNIPSYKLIDFNGAKAYAEEEYPNIIFAKDGEIYNFEVNGRMQKFIVIGGAYSVDKKYRLEMGYRWFESEQPTAEIKEYVESQLKEHEVDYVLSHTAPLRYEPVEWFISLPKDTPIDKSTENWLDTLYDRYGAGVKKWYCGHYHGEKVIDNVRFLFETIMPVEFVPNDNQD